VTILQRQTYLVYSPTSEQSLTISRFLRRYRRGAELFGVTLHDEYETSLRGVYDRIVSVSEIDSARTGMIQIPTGAKSTRLLLQNRNVVLGSVTLTQDALRVYDKAWIIAMASDVGIPTPITWQSLTDVTSYPLFYKQNQEWGGGARGIAKNEREVPFTGRDTLIFQELLISQGTYGVSFLAEQGRLLTHYVHFERESIPKEGGSAVIVEEFSDRRLLEYTQRLIQALDYSGWGLVEYKYCPRRKNFVFMEVNAKFWASCEFAFRNNPLFLKLLFDIDSKETPVQRMVFVERAIARGIPFLISHLHIFVNGSDLQVYPGWMRRSTGVVLPQAVRRSIKRLKSRLF
jgi:hypothetical protein